MARRYRRALPFAAIWRSCIPAPALFGNDAWQRAQVEMWMRRIEFALMSRIGAVWINTHKYTAHLGHAVQGFWRGQPRQIDQGHALAQ